MHFIAAWYLMCIFHHTKLYFKERQSHLICLENIWCGRVLFKILRASYGLRHFPMCRLRTSFFNFPDIFIKNLKCQLRSNNFNCSHQLPLQIDSKYGSTCKHYKKKWWSKKNDFILIYNAANTGCIHFGVWSQSDWDQFWVSVSQQRLMVFGYIWNSSAKSGDQIL